MNFPPGLRHAATERATSSIWPTLSSPLHHRASTNPLSKHTSNRVGLTLRLLVEASEGFDANVVLSPPEVSSAQLLARSRGRMYRASARTKQGSPGCEFMRRCSTTHGEKSTSSTFAQPSWAMCVESWEVPPPITSKAPLRAAPARSASARLAFRRLPLKRAWKWFSCAEHHWNSLRSLYSQLPHSKVRPASSVYVLSHLRMADFGGYGRQASCMMHSLKWTSKT